MFWKTKPTDASKSSETFGFGKVVSGCANSLRQLIVLPTDPLSKSFESKVARLELEAEKLSDDPDYIERTSERLKEAAEDFGTKQRDAIDRTLHALNNGVRGLTEALEGCLDAGNKLETASSQSVSTLSTLHKAPNYEALCNGLQGEIQRLTSAISEHQSKVTVLHKRHSVELQELHARIDQAQSVAKTDYLTKIGNRRASEEALTDALKLVNNDEEFAFALIDLDGFKNINDTLGHTTGDRALVLFTERITKFFGKAATVCRLAGDEFTVLARGTEKHLISRMVIFAADLDTEPLEDGDRTLPVGCSFGAIQLTRGMSMERAVGLADHAMYANKAARKAQKRAA